MRRALSVLVTSMVVLAVLPAAPATATAATFTVTGTADDPAANCTGVDCSLRGALAAARTTDGPDIIVVPAGMYVVTQGPLDAYGDVEISGSGAGTTVLQGTNSRVLNVWSGQATLRDLAITGGVDLGQQGGGVYVVGGGSLVCERIAVHANTATSPGGPGSSSRAHWT